METITEKGDSHKPMILMYIFSQAIAYTKTLLIGVVGWLVAQPFGFIMQAAAPGSWFEPSVVSAVVAALAVIITQLIINRGNNKKLEAEKHENEDERHKTFSEKLQELTQQERNFLLGGLKELHQKEVQFLRQQLTIEKISDFESRMRAHRFGDELNRVHSHVYHCHTLMSQKGIEIPEFTLKFYEELMNGLDGEVDKFKESLEREMQKVIHQTS